MVSAIFKQTYLLYLRQYYQKRNAFEKLIQHYLVAKKEETKILYTLIKKRFDAYGLEMPYALECWIQDP